MNNLTGKKPPFLAKKAEKYYTALLDYVQTGTGSHEIDSYQLAILANAFFDYEQATKTLQNEGGFYNTPGGLKRLHPMNNIQAESLKTIRDLGQNFGINPKARELMLKSWKIEKQPDKFDEI
jgi:P27 family predicted phage terminase small subunit